jgi:hypothetical protein
MKFEERKILPKDGRTCVLEPKSPEYAKKTKTKGIKICN